MSMLQHYVGFDAAPPATPDDRLILADLTIGEMLAILQIANTAKARDAVSMLAQASGGTLQPNREAFMRLTARGVACRNGPRYMLTSRGKWLGSALIIQIEARA